MKKGCELCNGQARMYCDSDQASLCWDCDAKVHGANFLVAKHTRTILCHVCQSQTPWKAAGRNLGRTVSVCDVCVSNSNAGKVRKVVVADEEETTATLSRSRPMTVQVVNYDEEEDIGDDSCSDYYDDDGDDDDDGDGEDEEYEEDEDDENQVVPWTSTPPPPATASNTSSSGEEESPLGRMAGARGSAASFKRTREVTFLDSDQGGIVYRQEVSENAVAGGRRSY
ncbi:hypothetical protein Dimus_019057 [Dionaea muscipula]